MIFMIIFICHSELVSESPVDTVETHNYVSLQNETLKQVQGDDAKSSMM